MATKRLRSLILEMFPFELRVELDLLSRQRNLENDDQETKLFELFQKYNIDAVRLGMGTNRYGFKLNSFAVKFATNEDGRIDNMKEFKMATRLQPDVIKVYEISENGVLLVTEYIQPFETYGEMLRYEDQIKEILHRLSAVYLIGDVGISEINYGNWGLRIGTQKPVCLDFAYVYDVSSELFLCSEPGCRGRSMLVPSETYSRLICPNCGKSYTFESLRIRISNAAHMKEIGDLRAEGYVLEESNAETVLDEERSPYLVSKKAHRDESETQGSEPTEYLDDFVAL